MIKRAALILAALTLAGCAASLAPCERDGGIGGTGGCATAPVEL